MVDYFVINENKGNKNFIGVKSQTKEKSEREYIFLCFLFIKETRRQKNSATDFKKSILWKSIRRSFFIYHLLIFLWFLYYLSSIRFGIILNILNNIIKILLKNSIITSLINNQELVLLFGSHFINSIESIKTNFIFKRVMNIFKSIFRNLTRKNPSLIHITRTFFLFN